jgi:hypothetical protein
MVEVVGLVENFTARAVLRSIGAHDIQGNQQLL